MEVFLACAFVVNSKVLHQGTRGVHKFSGCKAGAIDYQHNVVFHVELSAFDLHAVAEAEPAARANRAAELLDLHEGWFLASWWIPFVFRWASFEKSVNGSWCFVER